MIGVIVNTLTVVVGSIIGLLAKKLIPETWSDFIMKGIALCVIYIGIDGAMSGENTLIAIISMALGAVIGLALDLDRHLNNFAAKLENRFKKPGENSNPIRAGISERYDNREGWITGDEWCEWAAPVWYRKMPSEKSPHYPFQGNYPSRHQDTDGINEGDVLRNFIEGRENDDEKHLCPLQLGVIERCVKLWSNPDDVVLSPFMGIGSEGYVAIRHNRRFIGCELKPSYFRVACANLRDAERRRINISDDLFGNVAGADAGKDE